MSEMKKDKDRFISRRAARLGITSDQLRRQIAESGRRMGVVYRSRHELGRWLIMKDLPVLTEVQKYNLRIYRIWAAVLTVFLTGVATAWVRLNIIMAVEIGLCAFGSATATLICWNLVDGPRAEEASDE